MFNFIFDIFVAVLILAAFSWYVYKMRQYTVDWKEFFEFLFHAFNSVSTLSYIVNTLYALIALKVFLMIEFVMSGIALSLITILTLLLFIYARLWKRY